MQELQALTKTAFMVSIIAQILPRLVVTSSGTAAVKRDLIMLLEQEAEADLILVQLRRDGVQGRGDTETWERSHGGRKDMHRVVSASVLCKWFKRLKFVKHHKVQEPHWCQHIGVSHESMMAGSFRRPVAVLLVDAVEKRLLPKLLASLQVIAKASGIGSVELCTEQSQPGSEAHCRNLCVEILELQQERFGMAIRRTFARQPLTRYEIYTEFLSYFVAREALKQQAATNGIMSADDLKRDAPKLAQALAIEMTL